MASPGVQIQSIQSSQLNGGDVNRRADYHPGPSLNGGGTIGLSSSRAGSAASSSLSSNAPQGPPGSFTSPPAQPLVNTPKSQATAPPPVQQTQTPVPVPVIPGQQAKHGAGEPPLIASDIRQQNQQLSSAPTRHNASGLAPPVQQKPQLPADMAKSLKFSDDYNKLSHLIKYCDADAVRRAIRDNFQKCLLGSAYHLAFVMNVAMHRADDSILSRVVRDFGAKFVSAGKHDFCKWMEAQDLDDVSDGLLGKASDTFLDKALVMRLHSIEARRLVNALARAERLGYDKNDIVENEHVIPTTMPGGPPAPPVASTAPPAEAASKPIKFVSHGDPPPEKLEDPNKPECSHCHRVFAAESAWSHHVKKEVCTRPNPTYRTNGYHPICPHCGQSFGAQAGLQYHLMSKVCGDFGPVTKEDCLVKAKAGPERPAPESPLQHSGSNSPAPSQMPAYAAQTPQSHSQRASQTTPASNPIDGNQRLPLGTPQAKDMAHLTESQIKCLVLDLQQAERDFKAKIAHAKALGLGAADLEKKLQGFRNSYACKQSTVRKRYGIKLRERRNRAEMDAERNRMGYGSVPRRDTPSEHKHANKRARLNDAGDSTVTSGQATPTQRAPIKQVAVADIGGGLSGSNATAATEDPTVSTSPPSRPSQTEASGPSSSSLQGNHDSEAHVPNLFTKRILAGGPNGGPSGSPSFLQQGNGMTAQELLRQMTGDVQMIDDSSSSTDSDSPSDSDSDSDSGSDDGW